MTLSLFAPRAGLGEKMRPMHMADNLILESTTNRDVREPKDLVLETFFGTYELVEGTEKEPLPSGAIGILVFDCIQEGDKTNRNGRIYVWEILRREASQHLNEHVKQHSSVLYDGHIGDSGGYYMYGAADRKLSEAVGKWMEYTIDDTKAIIGPAKMMILDTARGRDALALARAKVPLGVSSVGRGSMSSGKHKGRHGDVEGHVVGNDYKLMRWDVVMDPSVSKARSSGLKEGTQEEDKVMWKTLAEMREKAPEEYKKLVVASEAAAAERLRPEYRTVIESAVSKAEIKIRKELTAKLQAPIAEQLEAKDSELDELRAENKSLSEEKDALEEQVDILTEALLSEDEDETDENEETDESGDVPEAVQEQLNELQDKNRALEEQITKDREERQRSEARTHVLEQTASNPFGHTIRIMVLGPTKDQLESKDAKTKALANKHKGVVPPKDLTEAKKRLADIRTMAEGLGVDSELGTLGEQHGEGGERKVEITESAGAKRLRTLSGIKPEKATAQ